MTGIGLTGAQGAGKTTLAKAFADQNNIGFIPSKTTQIFQALGLDPAGELTFEERMKVQNAILDLHEAMWASHPGVWISDRTPLDFLAYTLADVRQQSLTEEQDKALQQYMKDCFAVTNRFFAAVVIVPSALPLVHREGKGSILKSYVDHVSFLIAGLAVHDRLHVQHFRIPTPMTDLSKRMQCLDAALDKTVERHETMIASAKEAGSPIVFH